MASGPPVVSARLLLGDAVLAAAVVHKLVYALVEVDRIGAPAAADRIALAVRDVDGVVGTALGVDVVAARSTQDAPRSLVGRLRVPGVRDDVVVSSAAYKPAMAVEVVVPRSAREDVAPEAFLMTLAVGLLLGLLLGFFLGRIIGGSNGDQASPPVPPARTVMIEKTVRAPEESLPEESLPAKSVPASTATTTPSVSASVSP